MKVLSLFDGMSCGRLALQEAEINVTEYHASEIDKYAIQVTKANWPDTIHIGSVTNVNVNQHYDLLIGGSPCQSFSFAGKRKGMATKDEQEILTLDHYLQLKADGYEFEGQSYLFWEYVRILAECRVINPNIKFLLENVLMAEKWERVITYTLGVAPIKINSALVSAQNRTRLYWTNIGLQPQGLFGFEESIIQQPKDCGILLKDILETNIPEKYYLSKKAITRISNYNNGDKCFADNNKALCLAAAYYRKGRDNQYVTEQKNYNLSKTEPFCVAMRGRNPDNPKSRKTGLKTEQQLEHRNDGKTNTLTTVQKDNLIMLNENQQAKFKLDVNADKANTLTLAQGRGGSSSEYMDSVSKIYALTQRIRTLTPTECCRLQTVPDNYFFDETGKQIVSDTQIYKQCGNGWTIKVIAHIFSYF